VRIEPGNEKRFLSNFILTCTEFISRFEGCHAAAYKRCSEFIKNVFKSSLVNLFDDGAKWASLSQLGIDNFVIWSNESVDCKFYFDEASRSFQKMSKFDSKKGTLDIQDWKISKCVEYFAIASLFAVLQRRASRVKVDPGLPVQAKNIPKETPFAQPYAAHRNLVMFVKSSETGKLFYEDLAGYIPLHFYLVTMDKRVLCEKAVTIAQEVACGIFALHCQNIGHGGITTASILIHQTTNQVKIVTRSCIESLPSHDYTNRFSGFNELICQNDIAYLFKTFYPFGNSRQIINCDVLAFARLVTSLEILEQKQATQVLRNLTEAALKYSPIDNKASAPKMYRFLRELTFISLRVNERPGIVSSQTE
jgi:hypothetical protein